MTASATPEREPETAERARAADAPRDIDVTVRGERRRVPLTEMMARQCDARAYKAATTELARRREALTRQQAAIADRPAPVGRPADNDPDQGTQDEAATTVFDSDERRYLAALGFEDGEIADRADPRAAQVVAEGLAFRRHLSELAARGAPGTPQPRRPEARFAELDHLRRQAKGAGDRERIAYIEAMLGLA